MNLSTNTEQGRNWQYKIELAIEQSEDPVLITTLRRHWNSATRPILARGIDKCDYVIKGQQVGRQIIAEQIVARLGIAMQAPVGEPKIVEVDGELIEEDFAYFTAGTAHGLLYIPDCSDDRDDIRYINEPENRERFAILCVLYGWTKAGDRQFIYKKAHPHLVYSVDHGHFFAGGQNWTIQTLLQVPKAALDSAIASFCRFSAREIQTALDRLTLVTEDTIIQAVAAPPKEWQITIEERVAIVEYLVTRRQELLESQSI